MRGAAARWLRGAAPCRRPHDSQALVYAGLDRRERQRPTLLPSGTASGAVAALKAGAFDYVTKPLALDQLRSLVKSALSLPSRTAATRAGGPELLGSSAAIRKPAPKWSVPTSAWW